MSDFMMEVNDALRAKQLEAFWNKYGIVVIGIVVATVLATAVGVIWNGHMNKVLAKDTDAFVQAMDAGDDQTIINKLAELSEQAHQPVKSLIDLTLAQKYEEAEKFDEAYKLYKSVYDQSRVPEATRSVARLGFARLGLTMENADTDALLAAIDPLTKKENGFRPSALELKGLVLRKKGQDAEANAIFAELSEDVTVSSTLRQRAKALIRHEAVHAQK